jgi:hypothetical protein
MSDREGDYVELKWGTIKGYRIEDPETFKLMEAFYKEGVSLSAAADRPDESRREILCQIIDRIDKPVYLQWDGKYVSVDEAKKYVREYLKF